MSDDEKGKSAKETIADEAKELSKEVYRDVGKPVLAPIGDVAGGLVRLVLWPVKLAVDTMKEKLERFGERVAGKLEKVPPDRLLPAPATIAGPAALHYALLGDGDDVAELREMFENLLATSMDRETASDVHPAFVQMLSQLTPDEAWLLKSITKSDHAALFVQDFRGAFGDGTPRGLWTLLGRGIGIDESRLPQYLSNLDRLGILAIDRLRTSLEDHDAYDKIEALVAAELRAAEPARQLSLSAASIHVTALGEQFLATCAKVQVPPARYG
jgi:hypothetical protein